MERAPGRRRDEKQSSMAGDASDVQDEMATSRGMCVTSGELGSFC